MHPECPDYDLCEKCEAAPIPKHPENHPMLKTKIPLRVDVQHSAMEPARKVIVCTRGATQPIRRNVTTFGARPANGRLSISELGRKLQNGDQVLSGRNEYRHVTPAPFAGAAIGRLPSEVDLSLPGAYTCKADLYDEEEDGSNLQAPLVPERKGDVPAESDLVLEESKQEPATPVQVKQEPLPVPSPLPTRASTPLKEPVTPLDIFSWVRHVNIEPGCTLPAGAEFTKIWKLKHFASGAEFDFEKVHLVHKSIHGMLGEACKTNVEFKREDVVDDQEIEVKIEGLKVPAMEGEEIVEWWRFEDEKGVLYGQPLRLRSVVALVTRQITEHT